ncbi:DNA-binding TFAR19-related protein [Hesseltinella vesiculosa]|uniref:DNA-binding TFAR19-related protein n=1 Tax=Hesseltinella vesiculosa TaxID=101127 RepID=A0A1X2GSD7_9FUNG|nr:DNA-binding TFAR19-related protein [Hesseltinella vesiculosa]
MDDDELQAIRAKRLAELQGQKQACPRLDLLAMMTTKRKVEEMRRNMLYQILDGNARERLGRIHMVKAEKARAVEDLLIRMAQTNQLRGKVSEPQLIDLLGRINEQEPSASQNRVVFNRRRFDDDSDDDYDL